MNQNVKKFINENKIKNFFTQIFLKISLNPEKNIQTMLIYQMP